MFPYVMEPIIVGVINNNYEKNVNFGGCWIIEKVMCIYFYIVYDEYEE